MSNTCTIFVHDLKVMVRAGIYAHEKKAPQPMMFSLELVYARKSGRDSLDTVISYEKAVRILRALAKKKHYNFLEELGDTFIAAFSNQKNVRQMTVTLRKIKPWSPTKNLFKDVAGVGVRMTWKK